MIDRKSVVSDALGGTAVLVVGRSATRTVRACERGRFHFRPGSNADELLAEGTDQVWRIEEDALVSAAAQDRLPRLAGHLAYWFGWFAFNRDTPVYSP